MPKDEKAEFLKEFEPKKDDILDEPLNPEVKEEVVIKEELEEKESLSNRQLRRMREKLQAERESSIALAARLEALTESQRFRSENEPSEYLKSIERIYGTNSPEAIEATELLKSALKGVKEEAKREAQEAFREEQRQSQEAVRKEEQRLDSFIEEIEDENNVILSETQKRGFFQLLEKMSPKDASGEIVAYADPSSVWEIYAEKTQKKPDNRAKDLSSRSMVSSGTSKESKLEDDATARFLKEQGII